jgi:hypothetical protein
MASLQPPNKRKFILLTVASLLLAFAGVAMAKGGDDFRIRSLAMIACFTSLACIRRIRVRKPSSWATPLRRPIGIISIVLVPIMAMASFFLYRDAVQGYHQSWPLYLFVWTGVICSLCWAFLVAVFFAT